MAPTIVHRLFCLATPMAARTDSATFSAIPHKVYSQANPIDLTSDDDDDRDQYNGARGAKRLRTESPRQDFASYSSSSQSSSSMTGTMQSSTRPELPPMASPSMFAPQNSLSTHAQFSAFAPPPNQSPYIPHFATPGYPSYFVPPPSNHYAGSSPPPNGYPYQQPASQSFLPAPQSNHVIDLTNSPSPPPASLPLQTSQPPLPPELPPKTPVCIGQLTVTALVLYPVPYLAPQNPGEMEWVPVRLQYEHNPNKMSGKDTIHIKTPSERGPNGENVSGEIFGVIEQKVSDSLGPMLGKGLIRLESRIRKGTGSVSLVSFIVSYS